MTSDRFANALMLFATWNVLLAVANMVLVIVFDWPVVICGSVSGLIFMLVGIKFTSWLYWETCQSAFEARRQTENEV